MSSPPALDPTHIMQVGFGFWPAKVLLTATAMELFTVLDAEGPMTAEALGERLKLHPRGTYDFFDALVAMGMLRREGNGPAGQYSNTPETATFLSKRSPHYIGGLLEMGNTRLYPFWGDLDEGLRTGQPQNEKKHSEKGLFETLYEDEAGLEGFLQGMVGASRGNVEALAEKFDFSKYKTLCDVGGATGLLSITVAKRHPHLQCVTWDLPKVKPIAERTIAAAGVGDRVKAAAGDFFNDPLPAADVITMGLILHDWNLEEKMRLIRKVYDALPEGGVFIVVENLIDDARRANLFGLLMSLNMLIENGDAFDYTGADFRKWCTEVGFKKVEIMPLAGPASAGIAYK